VKLTQGVGCEKRIDLILSIDDPFMISAKPNQVNNPFDVIPGKLSRQKKENTLLQILSLERWLRNTSLCPV